MLSEWMMDLGLGLLDIIYSMLGVLPEFSPEITSTVDDIFTLMFSGINLVGIFVDVRMVKILIPLVIGIIHADRIIKLVMFVLKKIPILGIK